MFVFTKSSEAIIASSDVESSQVVLEPLIPVHTTHISSNDTESVYSASQSQSVSSSRHDERHNELGTINGCYVPCLLNIMGIVLFERLGWGIGQVGILYVLLIYVIAEVAAILTVLSLSAIVTNGNMKGGGSYYMISRTLGAEFGGSVGILFYCAYAVNIAFCCSGCAEEIIKTWYNASIDWTLNLLFSSIILLLCLCVALLGARIFTKVNVLLFVVIFIAIVLSILAGFSRNEFVLPDFEQSEFKHQEWNAKQLKENAINHGEFTVHMVFGVLFSGVTGLMEGANLSGDLANPAKSIPTGTLSAIGTAICAYFLMIFSFGGSFDANVLQNVTTIPQNVSWGWIGYYLSILGVLISSSSSALGSLFGGSRVLQAIARDNIFPKFFDKLGYGTVKGDEPIFAVIVTWILAQGLLFIGGINSIAPIATSFFCLSYSTVNLCCFLLCISGQPNFRPLFKYFSKWTALLGLVMNIFIMFYVDFLFASVSLFCAICIFVYLVYRNATGKHAWGDVGQSVIFHQIRKYLLKLNAKNMDKISKLWRPQILLFVDNHEIALVDFCNSLKKGGLYIIGSVLNARFMEKYTDLNREWIRFIKRNKLKAFPQISMAPDNAQQLLGYQNLLSLAGLGPMKPNTVVLPLCKLEIDQKRRLDSNRKLSAYDQINTEDLDVSSDDEEEFVFESPNMMDYSDYMELLRNILTMKKNIILTRNFEHFDYNLIVSKAIKSKFNVPALSPKYNKQSLNINFKPRPNLSGSKKKVSFVSPLFNPVNAFEFGSKKKSKLRKKMVLPDDADNKWIDVWIDVEKYSFDINDMMNKTNGNYDAVFPSLMLQFAHILSINKVWKTKSAVRILLLVPTLECNDDNDQWLNFDKKHKFEETLNKLRLSRFIEKVETIVLPHETDQDRPRMGGMVSDILSPIKDMEAEEEEKATLISDRLYTPRMSKYFNEMNDIILRHSDQTYFCFLSLPDFDSTFNEKIYIENLHILTQGLPPTALVKCGQQIPVISLDI
eukprot:916500_1